MYWLLSYDKKCVLTTLPTPPLIWKHYNPPEFHGGDLGTPEEGTDQMECTLLAQAVIVQAAWRKAQGWSPNLDLQQTPS